MAFITEIIRLLHTGAGDFTMPTVNRPNLNNSIGCDAQPGRFQITADSHEGAGAYEGPRDKRNQVEDTGVATPQQRRGNEPPI